MQGSLAGARHAVDVSAVHQEGLDDFALTCHRVSMDHVRVCPAALHYPAQV